MGPGTVSPLFRRARPAISAFGGRGFRVNTWQTTYFHELEGEDPVLEWVRSTTLRPIFKQLPDDEHEEVLAEFGALLREAYPSLDGRTVFSFKRTFVVATKA